MKTYLFKEYDRLPVGKIVLAPHLAKALWRNHNAYGCPASKKAMQAAEKAKIALKPQLIVWCKGLGIDHDGTAEELKERILEATK